MRVKQFLKPEWKKVILFFILFTSGMILSVILNSCFGCYDTKIGYPGIFYITKGWPESEIGKTTFSIPTFIVDIVFWYLLSCLIIWVYDKVKKK